MFGGVAGRWMSSVGSAAQYGNIAIFGEVFGTEMREAEEHTGVGPGDKASMVGC